MILRTNFVRFPLCSDDKYLIIDTDAVSKESDFVMKEGYFISFLWSQKQRKQITT